MCSFCSSVLLCADELVFGIVISMLSSLSEILFAMLSTEFITMFIEYTADGNATLNIIPSNSITEIIAVAPSSFFIDTFFFIKVAPSFFIMPTSYKATEFC